MSTRGQFADPLETPIALFLFSRPDQTREVLDAVARARPRTLLVIADGPRVDRPDEDRLCRETRALIERISWPCDVRTNFAESNLGCKARLTSGLDWVFSQFPHAIVLEDDTVPVPAFFPFCQELLDRYRDEERVYAVRGFNAAPRRLAGRTSYHFSHIYCPWGWATWARAWRHYDAEMARWPALRETAWLEERLPMTPTVHYMRGLFDECYAGEGHSWDFQWMYSAWLRGGLAVVPNRNLIRNIGFGAGSGAPGGLHEDHPLAKVRTSGLGFPLAHPAHISPSRAWDTREWRAFLRLHRLSRARRVARALLRERRAA